MNRSARCCGLALIGAACALLLTSQTSKAAITTYTDRATWLAALGSPLSHSENFETFVSDTAFRAGPIDLSGFTLGQVGAGGFRNMVDVAPFEYDDNNGTKHAAMFVDSGIIQVELRTVAPMRAFGADFTGTAGNEFVDVWLISSNALIPLRDIPETPNASLFWGYIATGIDLSDRLRFSARMSFEAGEGFGMDNVGLVIVPEPSTVALSVAVGLVLAHCARRRGVRGPAARTFSRRAASICPAC